MNLTEHFTLEEFTYSTTASQTGINNRPTPPVLAELKRLAEVMEKVRTLLHSQPITITSGYRCPALNTAVGGASNSQHLTGDACDFIVPGYGSPHAVCLTLEPHLAELGVDQLIYEYGDWVHLGLPSPGNNPRCQCLTIDSGGTKTGFPPSTVAPAPEGGEA